MDWDDSCCLGTCHSGCGREKLQAGIRGVLRNQAGCCGCSQAHLGDQEAGGGLHRYSCRLRKWDPLSYFSPAPPTHCPSFSLSLPLGPDPGNWCQGGCESWVCVPSASRLTSLTPAPQVTALTSSPWWDMRGHFSCPFQ